MTSVASVCPYCGVGCGVLIDVDAGRITGVRGDPAHPSNRGRLCSKGSQLQATTGAAGRLLQPLVRDTRESPHRARAWPETLALLARRYAEVIEADGPDAVAFYLSGQLLTEDYYVFNKLARALIGTNNIDTNSRLCMSSAVTAYKATLGADAPPACYDDLESADLIVIAGANPAFAHPVLCRRLEAAKAARPALRIVCIDPRRTDTAELADLHLQIKPGTDVALFNGLLHLLIWQEHVDRDYIAAHTEGYAALRQCVRAYHPSLVAGLCGITETALETTVNWIAGADAMLSLYCQGLNQSTQGTAKNAALINLHLATGQIGRPGAGPLSLTGQPNAMGGREAGGMATLLPGHREPGNAAHRAEVAALWGVPALPERPGLTAVELFEAAARGEIKALWIACTNPAHSLPDQSLVRAALERVDFVVLQEAFAGSETAAYADVLLSAATWGEKSGVMTNSERRIARVRAAVSPPGEAREDWRIALEFARALEAELRPGAISLFGAENAAALFDEHVATTRGRDLDIGALSHALLDAEGPQQWPRPAGASTGRARLYADGRFATADGRARFFVAEYRPTDEIPDARYPLQLNTGRLRDQWHGMSRSGRVPALHSHEPTPVLDVNPADLARHRLVEGDLVELRSRHGRLVLPVRADTRLRPGDVFLPMHWGERALNGAGANALTQRAIDPLSKQPELKATAIRLTRLDLPWRLVAMRGLDAPDEAAAWLDALRALLRDFDYASCGYFGQQRRGVVLRAASTAAPPATTLAAIDRLFGLDDERQVMRYVDTRRGAERRLRLRGNVLEAVRLSGTIAGHDWLAALIDGGEDVAHHGVRLLGERAPGSATVAARAVCVCAGVDAARIEACLDAAGAIADPVAMLKAKLGCGAQCGSCVPELRRLCAGRLPATA